MVQGIPPIHEQTVSVEHGDQGDKVGNLTLCWSDDSLLLSNIHGEGIRFVATILRV